MSIVEKSKKIRSEIESIVTEEKVIKQRIMEMRNLISEKKRRAEMLKSAKAEEEKLLAELGNL